MSASIPEWDDEDFFNPLRLAWILSGLLRAVARLALAPDDQREYLRRTGTGGSADELALELDYWARMLNQLEEAGWIPPSAADLVRRIDGTLDVMSDEHREELWEPSALSTAPEWAEVRALAKEVVFGIGQP